MNRDDIIRRASKLIDDDFGCTEEESRYYETTRPYVHELIADFALELIAEEREACAQIAFNAKTYIEAAAAIRARGQQ